MIFHSLFTLPQHLSNIIIVLFKIVANREYFFIVVIAKYELREHS